MGGHEARGKSDLSFTLAKIDPFLERWDRVRVANPIRRVKIGDNDPLRFLLIMTVSSSPTSRQTPSPTLDELDTLELAQALAERLAIPERDWHRLKSNRSVRAQEQLAAALVFLLKNHPEEALLALSTLWGGSIALFLLPLVRNMAIAVSPDCDGEFWGYIFLGAVLVDGDTIPPDQKSAGGCKSPVRILSCLRVSRD